jgi:hypothetical protein
MHSKRISKKRRFSKKGKFGGRKRKREEDRKTNALKVPRLERKNSLYDYKEIFEGDIIKGVNFKNAFKDRLILEILDKELPLEDVIKLEEYLDNVERKR